MNFDNMIKVTFLGEVGTGKSSIINRFVNSNFKQSSPPTIGAANLSKSIMHMNQEFTFSIWDTAGQERYKSISKMLYRDAKAVVLVFDLTSKASFEALNSWHASVEETSPTNIIIIIAGNKIDAENPQVNIENAQKYAKNINASLFFVSAKTGESVNLIFEKIAEILVSRGESSITKLQDVDDKSSFLLSDTNIIQKKKKCC